MRGNQRRGHADGASQCHAERNHRDAAWQLRLFRPDAGRARFRELGRLALTVLARVVSRPAADRLILDSGSKTLTNDVVPRSR